MDFSPVRSLGGNLEIALDGLYRYYTVNRVISAGSLLGTRGANVPIELSGNHTVFVEGMAFQGNYVVVPLHGIHFSEELELEFDEDGEEVASPAETVPKFTETRVATAITATLFGTDSNGQEQSLTGRAYYDFRGTDLIFDTRENADFMDIPHSRLQLRIETVAVRLPRLTLGLSLNYASVLPSVERNEIITAITDHFASRGGVAQVAAMSQTDNQIYAIVIEQHQAISGGRLQRSAGTYHITAELLANGTVQVTSMTNAQRR
jgi:threonine dehydrogenase-like Zn-dependent dehydrogenase